MLPDAAGRETAMGSRNLDRIHISEWRDKVRTAADMWSAGWKVRAQCESCRNVQVVDLENVVRLGGPGVTLWDKTGRCKQIIGIGAQCEGRVFFMAQARGGSGFQHLGKPPRVRQAKRDPLAFGPGELVDPNAPEQGGWSGALGPTPPDPEEPR